MASNRNESFAAGPDVSSNDAVIPLDERQSELLDAAENLGGLKSVTEALLDTASAASPCQTQPIGEGMAVAVGSETSCCQVNPTRLLVEGPLELPDVVWKTISHFVTNLDLRHISWTSQAGRNLTWALFEKRLRDPIWKRGSLLINIDSNQVKVSVYSDQQQINESLIVLCPMTADRSERFRKTFTGDDLILMLNQAKQFVLEATPFIVVATCSVVVDKSVNATQLDAVLAWIQSFFTDSHFKEPCLCLVSIDEQYREGVPLLPLRDWATTLLASRDISIRYDIYSADDDKVIEQAARRLGRVVYELYDELVDQIENNQDEKFIIDWLLVDRLRPRPRHQRPFLFTQVVPRAAGKHLELSVCVANCMHW